MTTNSTPTVPIVTANSSVIFCWGGNVVIKSNKSGGNQWYKDESIITSTTNSTYIANTSGQYSVRVTTNACLSPSSNNL